MPAMGLVATRESTLANRELNKQDPKKSESLRESEEERWREPD